MLWDLSKKWYGHSHSGSYTPVVYSIIFTKTFLSAATFRMYTIMFAMLAVSIVVYYTVYPYTVGVSLHNYYSTVWKEQYSS